MVLACCHEQHKRHEHKVEYMPLHKGENCVHRLSRHSTNHKVLFLFCWYVMAHYYGPYCSRSRCARSSFHVSQQRITPIRSKPFTEHLLRQRLFVRRIDAKLSFCPHNWCKRFRKKCNIIYCSLIKQFWDYNSRIAPIARILSLRATRNQRVLCFLASSMRHPIKWRNASFFDMRHSMAQKKYTYLYTNICTLPVCLHINECVYFYYHLTLFARNKLIYKGFKSVRWFQSILHTPAHILHTSPRCRAVRLDVCGGLYATGT